MLLGGIKGAYESSNRLMGAFANVMTDMAATGCPLCALFATPPCQTHACTLAPASGATTITGGAPTPVPLTGVNLFAFCEFPGVLTNEIGVLNTPARNFEPSVVVPGIIACSTTIRTSSIINCAGGTSPTVSFSICQDSDLSDGNNCPPAGPTNFCQPDPNATTGGACLSLTSAAPAAGQSFAFATSLIRISTAAGPDAVSCTPDDTYVGASTPAQIPVTTGSASATVLDYANVIGNNQTAGPIAGVAGPSCAQLRSSNISSGELVGAFPAADTAGSPLGDTVTSLRLVCS